MNKTALITGASNGIGYELAKMHAEKGDNLVLIAHNISKLDELKKELEDKHKVKVYTIGKDLSKYGATHSGFQTSASIQNGNLFESNNFTSSREVAEYGYRALMKGETVAFHGLKNTILANSVRFAHRSVVVKMARRIQAKKY
jgi:short-subunit dehydrogenase